MNDLIMFQNETIRTVILNSKLQLFEVKQLAELENKYRKQCRLTLLAYRYWKQQYRVETDGIELLYGRLKGIILRRHAENTVKAYWIIRTDFKKVFRDYLQQHSMYQPKINHRKAA